MELLADIMGQKQSDYSEQTPWPLVRERTIPTERTQLVNEI
jgi:hypothetical protein